MTRKHEAEDIKKLFYNHTPTNSALKIEREVNKILSHLLLSISSIDSLETSESQLKIAQSKLEKTIEDNQTQQTYHWHVTKTHIVTKYPFTRLRDQDKHSFSAILRVHFGHELKTKRWLWIIETMLKSRLDIIRETIAISSKSNGDASAVVATEAESTNPSDSLPIS